MLQMRCGWRSIRKKPTVRSLFVYVVFYTQKNRRRYTAMNPHTTLNLAKIALCAVETVVRNTSLGAEDYPPAS